MTNKYFAWCYNRSKIEFFLLQSAKNNFLGMIHVVGGLVLFKLFEKENSRRGLCMTVIIIYVHSAPTLLWHCPKTCSQTTVNGLG